MEGMGKKTMTLMMAGRWMMRKGREAGRGGVWFNLRTAVQGRSSRCMGAADVVAVREGRETSVAHGI